jgi:hypothetical protein
MTIEKRFTDLIKEYSKIKDEILEITDKYYDNMMYDIEGYQALDEEDFIFHMKSLRKQVEAFKLIRNGLKEINYIFG